MRRILAVATVLLVTVALVAGCGRKPAEQQPELKTLSFELYAYSNPRPYNPEGDKLAEAIKAELAKIGVEANIVTLPWAEYKKAIFEDGKGDAYLLGWIGDNGDADNFLYVHFHSSQAEELNQMRYKNEQADKLLEDARRTADPAERQRLYEEAQRIIAEEAPWVFFSHMKDFAAIRKGVKGFDLHPTGTRYFENIEVEGKKELVYARGADSIKLDPAQIDDGESSKVVNAIFEGLLRYKPGSTEVEPWLAESYTISPDGLTYTFKLRKGITFHDGTPFNADAVVYSIGRQLPGKANAEIMPYAEFTFGDVADVRKVDDYTVEIVLKQPNAAFLANLAMGLAAPIVSPAAHQRLGDDQFARNPVGTGPFMFERWEPDQQIVLKRNPNYWGGPTGQAKPKVETLIFKVTKENAVRADEIIAGQADVIDGISPADLERLRAAADVQVLEAAGMNVSYLGFRTDRPPFDDVRVRKAISMAIDRAAIVNALYKGNALLANGPLPPMIKPGYSDAIQPLPYDPEQAKQLLKEAGYATK